MAQRTKVLIAESDPHAVQAITSTLRNKGLEVVVANDAAHLLNIARQQKPDATVLDFRLPGGSVAALLRLRSNVYTATFP